MRRLIPDTIATRTLLVLLIGLSVSHILSMLLYQTEREAALGFTGGAHVAERIATVAQIVERAPAADRSRIVGLADSPALRVFATERSPLPDAPVEGWEAKVFRDALASHLAEGPGRAFRLSHAESLPDGAWRDRLKAGATAAAGHELLLASLKLRDGGWLNFAAPIDPPSAIWSFRFILSMAVMLVAVIVLSIMVVGRLVEPLSTFAQAAERLGANIDAPSIPERGPAEVRRAIRAFNRMQARIRRFVDDRVQMLAAMSHDLGTPITRLRLRAEFVEDPEQRARMLADIDEMQQMVFASLAFARGETDAEARATVDLRSMLQRVCDAAVDAGGEVRLEEIGCAVPYECQPSKLRRALTNLVDNAVKYGRRAEVSLREAPGAVVIAVDDEGPGIPPDLREEAFAPFRRLEASRNRETGGAGLGLSVARTVVRAHGGELSLANRPEGGLRAEITLPVSRMG